MHPDSGKGKGGKNKDLGKHGGEGTDRGKNTDSGKYRRGKGRGGS